MSPILEFIIFMIIFWFGLAAMSGIAEIRYSATLAEKLRGAKNFYTSAWIVVYTTMMWIILTYR